MSLNVAKYRHAKLPSGSLPEQYCHDNTVSSRNGAIAPSPFFLLLVVVCPGEPQIRGRRQSISATRTLIRFIADADFANLPSPVVESARGRPRHRSPSPSRPTGVPAFDAGIAITLSVDENSPAGTKVGSAQNDGYTVSVEP